MKKADYRHRVHHLGRYFKIPTIYGSNAPTSKWRKRTLRKGVTLTSAAPLSYTARLCTFPIHQIRFYPPRFRTRLLLHIAIVIRLVTTHPDCPHFVCAHSVIHIFLATLCFFDTKRLCTMPLLHIPIHHIPFVGWIRNVHNRAM